ncbi:hypothetical protein EDD11_004888 [Mortierella claussenii]|nr:hypothetical protein EDD11_004888 [Mortierella claussenii]
MNMNSASSPVRSTSSGASSRTVELDLGNLKRREPLQEYQQSAPYVGTCSQPVKESAAAAISEEEETFMAKICTKIEHLSEEDRLQPQLLVLFSDIMCPILKYHSELLSEIVRVLPGIIASGQTKQTQEKHRDMTLTSITDTPEVNRSFAPNSMYCNILAVIMSLKSERHVKAMLPKPFHMDLFDRKRMVDIQAENSSPALRRVLIVDDSWARIQAKAPAICLGTEETKTHYVQLLTQECQRLDRVLQAVSDAQKSSIGPMELICVLDQTEAELYGAPAGIPGKVIFVVTKDRDEWPKSVALKTRIHWIDRIFERSDYTLEWIHANVIPLYVELPDGPHVHLAGQRQSSTYAGVAIQLSAKRPEEAYTRVKVRQGQGLEVLESCVLEEIERTKIFEMQAIRKPMFLHLMGAMSLESTSRVESEHPEQGGDAMGGSSNNSGRKAGKNPFL